MSHEKLVDQIVRHDLSIKNHSRGTDKNGPHSYIKYFYDPLFEIIQEPSTLLEIGSFGGASLVLWKSTFPGCEVIGFEIDSSAELYPKAQQFLSSGEITLHFVDAYSDGFDLVSSKLFDLIIDDGPHTIKSQIKALRFYRLLRPDGTLVIEDLYYSRWTAIVIWVFAPVSAKRDAIFINFFKYSKRRDDCILLFSRNKAVRKHFR